MKILVLDPSGNFKEGKGTTGYCTMIDGEPMFLGHIKSTEFDSAESYWNGVVGEIRTGHELDAVVMEGYRLYNHKGMAASTQANSELETPQLIGAIKLSCYQRGIPCHIQFAHEVKTRWSDDVLVNTGVLERKSGNRLYFDGKPTNNHQRDALRHAMHWWRYKR